MNNLVQMIEEASQRLFQVIRHTPLEYNQRLSEKYQASIYLKREDLQEVRSFKIRGAYNLISSLTEEEKRRGVVCASAGNHAQGFAYSCARLGIRGTVFMPVTTPKQKVDKVKRFGGKFVEVKLTGTTYDEASAASKAFCEELHAIYVHPFDDYRTIAGQGTIAKEILADLDKPIDYVVACLGGGGLISGLATYFKSVNPAIQIIGSEPAGAQSMIESLKAGHVVKLEHIDTFVDGAAVQRIGDLTFAICQEKVEQVFAVEEGKICKEIIDLYQNEGIIVEPAGILSVAALDDIADTIKGKTVVCIISGGNNDLSRYPEIIERSLVYLGRKHYFIIEFNQQPGQLKKFVNDVLTPDDDIALFEYIKKNNREKGAALVGIELKDKNDYEPLIERLDKSGLGYKVITSDDLLHQYLI